MQSASFSQNCIILFWQIFKGIFQRLVFHISQFAYPSKSYWLQILVALLSFKLRFPHMNNCLNLAFKTGRKTQLSVATMDGKAEKITDFFQFI